MLAPTKQTDLVLPDIVVHTFNPPPVLCIHYLLNVQPETDSGWGQQKNEQKKGITEDKTFSLQNKKGTKQVEHTFNLST